MCDRQRVAVPVLWSVLRAASYFGTKTSSSRAYKSHALRLRCSELLPHLSKALYVTSLTDRQLLRIFVREFHEGQRGPSADGLAFGVSPRSGEVFARSKGARASGDPSLEQMSGALRRELIKRPSTCGRGHESSPVRCCFQSGLENHCAWCANRRRTNQALAANIRYGLTPKSWRP